MNQAADKAQQGLRDTFLTDDYHRGRMFVERIPADPLKGFGYWWHAHAIDALTDGYLRTGDQAYLDLALDDLKGVRIVNGGHLINNYYDDMEWMALAMLRLWDITQDAELLKQVRTLWKNIQTGWNDHCGGGIAWRKMQLDYKNTPANAPAAILAFRLYLRFGDEDDLHWGERIARWQMENLVDKDTHYVHDGMNRQGDGKIDVSWQFTYNQGVVIGMLVEQYRITRDRAYLETALKVAKDSRQRFFGQNGGAMPYEGEDDVALFRSIFFRYLDQLSIELPEQGWLAELPVINATMIVERGMDEKGRIGGSWIMHPGEKIDLAQQACGVTVLEMAVRATEQLDK